MAEAVHVAGLAAVKVGTGGAGALELLGYTRNYADTTKEAYWVNVPGDQNGGDDGPPIEIIYLGETARVRMELTKYDSAVLAKVAARLNGATAGTPSTTGSMMFSGAYTIRLLIHAPNDPRNFPRAIPRMPIEVNRGTKFSTAILEFECHKDGSGVLYNAVTA